MKKILFLALIIYGFWQWRVAHLDREAILLDDAGNPVLLAFTFSACGSPCTNAIKELDKRGVAYQEVKVSQTAPDDDKNLQLFQSYKVNTMPLIAIGDDKLLGDSSIALAGFLARHFDDQYLTQAERRYFSKHVDADGNPKVVLYGTTWCPACAKLRKQLDEAGIPFEDIDVEAADDVELLTETMKIPGYPYVWYGYSKIRGFNINAIKAAM